MGLLVCVTCGRQTWLKPIKRGAKFKCGNCGCKIVLVLPRAKGADRPGASPSEAMRQTLAGLKRIAEHRGFKPGWVFFKFKTLFSRNPDGIEAEPEPATAELRLWIKRQAREWAKAKKATEPPPLFDQEPESPEIGPDGFIPGTLMTPEDFEAFR